MGVGGPGPMHDAAAGVGRCWRMPFSRVPTGGSLARIQALRGPRAVLWRSGSMVGGDAAPPIPAELPNRGSGWCRPMVDHFGPQVVDLPQGNT